MSPTTIHLRAESKPFERRSGLTPAAAKSLIEAGYTVNVERSDMRIYHDGEFEAIGANLVPTGSWPEAPCDHIILGVKGLAKDIFPIRHVHIHTAHVYKGQDGADQVLKRYAMGGGVLLDLEFLLKSETGGRFGLFGPHAGYVGAALAVLVWAWQLLHEPDEPFPEVMPWISEDVLIEQVKAALKAGSEMCGHEPSILITGAKGRSASGALELLRVVGITDDEVLRWDRVHTTKGGPFQEIIEADIFINCIYKTSNFPAFVDWETIQLPERKLSVICDVSCDNTDANNPVPLYEKNSSFREPAAMVIKEKDHPLSIISIDHLPSLLPRSASEAFSRAFLPHILKLKDMERVQPWMDSYLLYHTKLGEIGLRAEESQNARSSKI